MQLSSKINPDDFSLSDLTTYQSGVVQSAAHRNLRKFTDDCLKDHGLTTMQWFIVGTVYDAGDKGVRITELSKTIDTTLGFLTNSINLLESRGILERLDHASDSRSKMVVVSRSFRPKCQQIESDLRTKMRRSIYSKISPDELFIYIKVLYKLAELEK
jgi:DNA-binding MarR family transcriptional regulator